MFKKFLLSLGVLAFAGGSAVLGTQALLSDDVTLTANTFTTGTVDLQIRVGANPYADTQAGFSATLLPGQSSTSEFLLKNNDSQVDLEISAQSIVTGSVLDPSLVMVEFTAVDAINVPTGTPVSQSLAAWTTPTSLGLPNIISNGEQKYLMKVTIDPSVTASNVSSVFDFVFTGTQVVPAP